LRPAWPRTTIRPTARHRGATWVTRSSTTPAAGSTITIAVGRLPRGATQRRETATRARPALEAVGGVPIDVLDPDDPEVPATGAPPELVPGVGESAGPGRAETRGSPGAAGV
jgi:hypothetical protein